ncbi:uncharacterized protein LOC121266920 [Juglans microcarpa x Juglans regia]|uniref:uncharacterized protein LOC121266920 n=1 Tax=Juglans microcarpa x Juglans regia TaxID=2249226 RepID=UPI001B7F234D|nr:uncharacterized protein LOC121266920 [Juglans microcarpa x Juglans regia]
MEDSSKRNDFNVRRLSLIDVCSEDDSLLFNSSLADSLHHQSSENQEHGNAELLENVYANILEDTIGPLERKERVLQPSESPEPEMTSKNGKYNLRKSLAWDSAFFTSAGVLEPDELSCIIEGVEKDEKQKLTRIQEEVQRSADSISTLESDGLTLESLESDLFEDVRASIQKSSKVSNAAKARSRTGSGVAETQPICSKKKVELASRSKIKANLVSSKPNVRLQASANLTNQVSVSPRVSQSFASRRESTSSLAKRPMVLVKDTPSSTPLTKRASLSDNHAKLGKDAKSASGRGAPVSKIPASGGSRNNVPRPPVSSKTSSLGSSVVTKTQTTSSFDSSGSVSSDSVSKSSTKSMKTKKDSITGRPPSFGSTSKTPSRTASRNKVQSGSPHLSAMLISSSKVAPSTSPASSISEWSSESYSSNSTVKQRSNNSRASLESTCKEASVDGDVPHVLEALKQCNEQGSVGHETLVIESPGECVKKASSASGALPHLASMRPSGLRLPSPKIGFFDGVKSTGRTPPGIMSSHPVARGGLPKTGAGNVTPNGGPNKAKSGNPQTCRTLTAIRSIKADPQRTLVNTKSKSPTPLKESSVAAIRSSSASRNVKSCPGISPRVQNRLSPKVQSRLSPKGGGESQLKDKEIEAEGCDIGMCASDIGIAEKSGSLDVLKDKVCSETKGSTPTTDMNVIPINGELNTSDSGSNFLVEKDTSYQKVGEEAKYVQADLKNDLPEIKITNVEEKFELEDQVDDVSRQVGAMDINKESLDKNIGDSLSLSQLNVGGKDISGALELSRQRELHGCTQQDEYLKCLSKPVTSNSPTTFEITSSMRTPFSEKDSFCNMDGFSDVLTGLKVVEVEKAAVLTSLESSMKENS